MEDVGHKLHDQPRELHYLPFYFVEGHLNASYEAAVLLIYTERSQSGTRIMRRTVRVAGRVSLTDVAAVLARRTPWGLSDADRSLNAESRGGI